MQKRAEKLTTARQVQAATEPGLHPVGPGPGLFLQVKGPDVRSWIYRFQMAGKPRWLGLGSFPGVSLIEARAKRDDARAQIRRGVDPVAERKSERAQARAATAAAKTFRQWTEQYVADHDRRGRNAKHRQQWQNTLAQYAFPTIGDLPPAEISARHIVDVLHPIWAAKHETARRVRGRIATVLDYAADPDDIAYRNPAELTAQLKKKLPAPAKRATRHHPALPYDDLPAFMAALRERDAPSARALEFTILTAARTSEALGARWSEISGDLWTAPAERMKGAVEHRVPLPPQALTLLESLPRDGEYVFPGVSRGKPLSNMAMLVLLDRMGYGQVTTHGFRSTFRDWAAERTAYPREIAEKALAHTIGNETEAAYQRGDLLEKRRKLMQAWADYCSRESQAARRGVVAITIGRQR
jgi:integrase